jgi:type VI secretion system ImpB/VipA family protein
MTKNNAQQQLSRVRPPRVHIAYDVDTGNAIEKKELPFVVGIMSDLSGKSETPLPPLKERKFVEIDRDNFDDVINKINPYLAYQVDNKLVPDLTLAIACPDVDFAKAQEDTIVKQIKGALISLSTVKFVRSGIADRVQPPRVIVVLEYGPEPISKHRLTAEDLKQRLENRQQLCQEIKQRLDDIEFPDGAGKPEIDSGRQLNVQLRFNRLEDFHPSQLIHQVEPLHQLYRERQRLNDLIAKLDGNDKLENLLQKLVTSPEQLEEITCSK